MTSDESNPLGDDVLRALRERARVQAPAAARARVAARLSAAGAGVLTGATAAAASSAKAASAATLSGLALSKTFALGLALGVGTAVVGYSVSSIVERPQPHPSDAAVTLSSPVLPKPPAVSDAARARPDTDAVEPPRPVNPTPELPRSAPVSAARASSAATDPASGLAEQQALLDGARDRLRTGDPARALAAIEQHRARFPRTIFGEEREVLAIRALVALDRRTEARARTAAFARRFPDSLALSALHKSVGLTRETVTEPNASPQTNSEGSALR